MVSLCALTLLVLGVFAAMQTEQSLRPHPPHFILWAWPHKRPVCGRRTKMSKAAKRRALVKNVIKDGVGRLKATAQPFMQSSGARISSNRHTKYSYTREREKADNSDFLSFFEQDESEFSNPVFGASGSDNAEWVDVKPEVPQSAEAKSKTASSFADNLFDIESTSDVDVEDALFEETAGGHHNRTPSEVSSGQELEDERSHKERDPGPLSTSLEEGEEEEGHPEEVGVLRQRDTASCDKSGSSFEGDSGLSFEDKFTRENDNADVRIVEQGEEKCDGIPCSKEKPSLSGGTDLVSPITDDGSPRSKCAVPSPGDLDTHSPGVMTVTVSNEIICNSDTLPVTHSSDSEVQKSSPSPVPIHVHNPSSSEPRDQSSPVPIPIHVCTPGSLDEGLATPQVHHHLSPSRGEESPGTTCSSGRGSPALLAGSPTLSVEGTPEPEPAKEDPQVEEVGKETTCVTQHPLSVPEDNKERSSVAKRIDYEKLFDDDYGPGTEPDDLSVHRNELTVREDHFKREFTTTPTPPPPSLANQQQKQARSLSKPERPPRSPELVRHMRSKTKNTSEPSLAVCGSERVAGSEGKETKPLASTPAQSVAAAAAKDASAGEDPDLTVGYHMLFAGILYLYYSLNVFPYLSGLLAGFFFFYLAFGGFCILCLFQTGDGGVEEPDEPSSPFPPLPDGMLKDAELEELKVLCMYVHTCCMHACILYTCI